MVDRNRQETRHRKISRKDAKAQRFGLSESRFIDALAFGVISEWHRGPAKSLEVVNDSTDSGFQEIFTEEFFG